MNTRPSPPDVALIAGPTASGKSALAMRLAERTGGTIVNADASQVYRDLRILSARPSAADEARVPHLLYGYRDGADACSAARWAADARAAIAAIHAAGGLPILVGGTGLYLRTLLDGIAPVPPIDPAIREAVRAMPVAAAHTALTTADPAAAKRLSPRDTTRVARALEVVRSTGRTIADWQRQPRHGGIGGAIRLHATVLLPPREALIARIDARAGAMVTSGAIEEVAALAARALPEEAPVMRAIGVAPLRRLIAGTLDGPGAIAAIAGDTRRYAKRQFTWFRGQTPTAWNAQECFGCDISKETLLFGG